MDMIKRFGIGLCLVATQVAINPAAASTQGTFGPTSTGSVTISASVPGRVRISGLSDVTFVNADPTVDAASAQNVCVWSNTSTRGYSITATGSGAANAFTLTNGVDAPVPYTVQWAGTSGQSTGTSLLAGAAFTGLTSTATNSDCSAGPAASASLVVTIGSAALQSMAAGSNYTGALTLVVAPE